MTRPFNPFTRLLTRATDRLYARPVSLAAMLCRDPLRTLHLISSNPETFGHLLPFGDTELRRQRISDLLTIARTYVAYETKMRADMRDQGVLPWPTNPL